VDPEKRFFWEGLMLNLLQEEHKVPYSNLVSHQLVGTTLSVFVREDILGAFTKVEIASKKTGMSGIAGNKGTIAIRLAIHKSEVCFVSSHFTAGIQLPSPLKFHRSIECS